MAQSSWPSPADSRVVDDLQYEQLVAQEYADGLLGNPTDTALVYANGSGLAVFVRAGRNAVLRGHGWASGTPDVSLAITSNSSGSTRTDLVVLGLDRSTWEVTAYVVAGTPGAGAPALTVDTGSTGTYEIPLAEVTVPSGAAVVSAGQVKVRHWWVRPHGYASAGADTRPVNAGLGALCTEGNDTLAWNGSRWVNVTSPPTAAQCNQVTNLGGTADLVGDSAWHDIPGAKWPTLVFTVPPTGRCFIEVVAVAQNANTSTSSIWVSYRSAGGGTGEGTDDSLMQDRGLSTIGSRISGSKRRYFTGLTPGATVTLTPVYFASSVGASNLTYIQHGHLIMEPSA